MNIRTGVTAIAALTMLAWVKAATAGPVFGPWDPCSWPLMTLTGNPMTSEESVFLKVPTCVGSFTGIVGGAVVGGVVAVPVAFISLPFGVAKGAAKETYQYFGQAGFWGGGVVLGAPFWAIKQPYDLLRRRWYDRSSSNDEAPVSQPNGYGLQLHRR